MTNNLKLISDLIIDYTADIENIEDKEYLANALVSHIYRQTELPDLYIKEVVQAFFDGFSC